MIMTTVRDLDPQTIAALGMFPTGAQVDGDSATWCGPVGAARDLVNEVVCGSRGGSAERRRAAVRSLDALYARLAGVAEWGVIPGGRIECWHREAASCADARQWSEDAGYGPGYLCGALAGQPCAAGCPGPVVCR